MTGYEGYTSIEFEREDRILTVRLANPRNPVNAVDGEFHRELRRLFAELKTETEARAIVLTGRGPVFSGGGDLKWFAGIGQSEVEEMHRDAKQLIWNLLDVEVPIIAALNGHAMGLGATIALLCDVIFMASSAQIGDPHVRAGVTAGDGGTIAWPLAIGPARAKALLMTGDPVGADEAQRIGLVTHVAPDHELVDAATAFAARLAAGPPMAIQTTKVAINQLLKDTALRSMDLAMSMEMRCFATEDRLEAMQAFAEKRAPRFTGR